MNALKSRLHAELTERLDRLCARFRFRWGYATALGDEEVEVSTVRVPGPSGRADLMVGVVCCERLMPVLTGYRWTVLNAQSGEVICSGEAPQDNDFRLSGLPPGEYRLEIRILPLAEPLSAEPKTTCVAEGEVFLAMAASTTLAGEHGRRTLAEFHSADGQLTARLVESPSELLLLEVEAGALGPDVPRLARFQVFARAEGPPLADGFIGIGEDGCGQINLSHPHLDLRYRQLRSCYVRVELTPADVLAAADAPLLARSLEATPLSGNPEPLQAALERFGRGAGEP